MMTENKQKLVPAIRFNGFTDTWEQREFSSTVTRISSVSTRRGLPRVEYEDIISGRGELNKDIYQKESTKAGIEFEDGDILFGKLRPYLNNWLLADFNGIAVGDFWVIRTNETDNKFVYYLIQTSAYQTVANQSTGTKMPRSDWNVVSKTVFNIPRNFTEQAKIGELFSNLDNLITLHQRKLDGLVTLKDGFLQQMFPAANEVMPRVRFAGFTGNWEERRLEEMLTERNEQFEESEDYPLMSFVGNVGVVPKGEQYDRSFLVKGDGKKYKKTELNDFIYSSNNLETGSIGLNRTGKAVISPVYSIFYSSNDSESLFVGLLSKRKDFINKMIHYRQGVMYGQWRIHERDFLKIIVLAPTISEQNRIIDFFKNFDEQIAAQTAKLEQLRQLKAAYLQRMFI